jgi:MFS family permease
MEYKWTVLTNTTLGVLMAMMNPTVLIIALPAIFRGINLNPLLPGSFAYLLWLLMGYGVVAASLVITFGRFSDMYGRVKLYRLGFAIFTVGSILLSVTPGSGTAAAALMIAFRAVQAVGAAMIMANGTALIADVFPVKERGKGPGNKQGRGDSRIPGRTHGRRRPRCLLLEICVPGQRPVRDRGHCVGLHDA